MVDRRHFLKGSGAALGLAVAAPGTVLAHEAAAGNRPKALFFDVNETLLDLASLKKSIGQALGNRPELTTLWFTTMLHYSLVLTTANQYEDFGAIGAATLLMVARNQGLTLSQAQAGEAVRPIRQLPAHPDVLPALQQLKAAGYPLISFTNSSNAAVQAQLKHAGLSELFDQQLSVEDLGKFKPHADAYAWAARRRHLAPAECLLVAAHGWDVAGAHWAGWRTAFISRPGQQLFPLAPAPEFSGPTLAPIAAQLAQL